MRRGARSFAALAALAAAFVAAPVVLDGSRSAGDTARAAVARDCPPPPRVKDRLITRPRWLGKTLITEYYPVRERWFSGVRVRAAGIPGRHRVDWLYGGHGVVMNGQGIGLDGRMYHFDGPYDLSWVNAAGRKTFGCPSGTWTNGSAAWLEFGWRNRRGYVTFPLARGGWSNGRAARVIPAPATPRFGRGPTRPLPYWKTVAVDPRLIPLGSRVFIPVYCRTPANGWFVARDTGGAILGRHVDVYRRPPASLVLRVFRGKAIYVIPPGTRSDWTPRCPRR